jgi:hypothetical protein
MMTRTRKVVTLTLTIISARGRCGHPSNKLKAAYIEALALLSLIFAQTHFEILN